MKNIGILFILVIGALSHAQPLKFASPQQIVEQLATSDQPITRSARNLKPETRNIDLLVQFDFDSAELQVTSKPLLDNLVIAMNTDRLLNSRFRVEGHTDSKGTESYNKYLSIRRAEAVINYLITGGVSKERLEGVGKGFSEPLFPNQPQLIENRRVRITSLQ